MQLSVIIPAYNEEQRIEKTLLAVDKFLRTKNVEYEIIVVNDGSSDGTVDVVMMRSLSIPNLRIINNEQNHGKGWVVRQGMLDAKGAARLFMDADGSTSIDHLDKMLPYLEKGYDVVISSRRVSDAELAVPQGFIRDFLGGIFRTFVRVLAPTGVIDSQNGFKLFSARAAENIFKRQRIFTWAFDVEILIIARNLGYSIKEVGVRWVNDGRSKVTLGGMFNMFLELLQIRVNLRYNVYDTLSEEYSAVAH